MWLSNLRLVLPDRVVESGALQLAGDKLAAVIDGPPPAATINLGVSQTLTAMPGFVDLHGDMIEQEMQPRARARFPVEMALTGLDSRLAANGITTAFDSVNWYEGREVLGQALCAALPHLQPRLLIEHYVHARFEVTAPEHRYSLLPLLRAGQVHLVSLMDHTPGQGSSRDVDLYVERVTQSWRKYLGDHFGADAVHQFIEEAQQQPRGWDAAADVAATARSLGVPLAAHDDDSPARVAQMAALGVYICEFPVTREAAEAARERDMSIVMGAPNALRGGSHLNNLSAVAGIAAGLVDILACDYYPAATLRAVYEIVAQGLCSLPQAVAMAAENPARAVGLTDRGRLESGLRADLILVAEKPTPHVKATFCGGRPVYVDRELWPHLAPLTSNLHLAQGEHP